jgi:hypothetical protein
MNPVDLPPDIVELIPCPLVQRPGMPLREMPFRADGWTPEEVAVLHGLFEDDHAIDEIAAIIGRGRAGVADKIAKLGLRRNSKLAWTVLEDVELARRYGVEPTATVALAFGRTCSAIYARARLIGLSDDNPPRWTEWEDAQLAEAYRLAVPVFQISALIGRPSSGISTRASALGLRHPSQPPNWTSEETARALELAEAGHRYRAILNMLAGEGFPLRTLAGFTPQLRRLGYGRGWGRFWTPEEDALLTQAYHDGASLTPLRTRLGRTPCSIRWRAEYLKLRGTHIHRNGWRTSPDWSDADIATLKVEYGTTPTKQLATKLGRTKAAITTRAHTLGLVHGYCRPYSASDLAALDLAHRHGIAIADLANALGRKAFSVSKYATKHGYHFGRRPLQNPPPTLRDILALPAPDKRRTATPEPVELSTITSQTERT